MARDVSGFADHPEDPNWSPSGYGNQSYGGQLYGKNAYDKSVDEDRAKGDAAQNVAPVQLDTTQSGQSRGLAMGALGMLQAQGNGTAPSAAGIMGQRANEEAAHGAVQAVGAQRSGGGGIAALRQAGAAGGASAVAGNSQIASDRLGEISRGQEGFTTGAGKLQHQDIVGAETDAGLAAQQRAINEQRQQYFERQAQNTQFLQHQNTNEFLRQQRAAALAQRQYEEAKTANAFNNVSRVVGGVPIIGGLAKAGTAGGGNPAPDAPGNAPGGESGGDTAASDISDSDPRAKRAIHPMLMGSLAHLMRGT